MSQDNNSGSTYRRASLSSEFVQVRNLGIIEVVPPITNRFSEYKKNKTVTAVVCEESELEDGQMRVVSMGDGKGEVLLIRQKGEYTALGSKCPHFGANLEHGILYDNHIRCAWHNSCYNIKTGDIEDFPGLNSLPCHRVEIEKGQVIVTARQSQLTNPVREQSYAIRSLLDERVFIIAGGGGAAITCAQTLRQNNFMGRIVMVAGENHLPYQRFALSKRPVPSFNCMVFKKQEYFLSRDIELHLGTKVVNVDPRFKKVKLSTGEILGYTKLFLATGASSRMTEIPGNDLKNIITMRTYDDGQKLQSAINSHTHLLVIGSSFIAMEIAASYASKVASLTIVSRSKCPFQIQFGETIGEHIRRSLEKKGVAFEMEKFAVEFKGLNGKLQSVVLNDKKELLATVCVVSMGITCNSQCVRGFVKLKRDGSIPVDEYLQTKLKDVYAGGDVSYSPLLGSYEVCGHLKLAQHHGYVAARNMLDHNIKLHPVPFFWTMIDNVIYRFCGVPRKYDDFILRGDLDNYCFAGFYISKGTVSSVITCNRDQIAAYFSALIHTRVRLLDKDIDQWLESLNEKIFD